MPLVKKVIRPIGDQRLTPGGWFVNEAEWDDLEQLVIACRTRAMEMAQAFAREGLTRSVKPDKTFVTHADLAIERELRRMIASRFPGHAVLGEEEGVQSSQAGAAVTWVIDPIDGTFSFMNGIPFYSSLLAVLVEGEPVIGSASLPELGWTLHARKGRGAYFNGERVNKAAAASVQPEPSDILAIADPYRFRTVGAGGVLTALLEDPYRSRTYPDALGYMLLLKGAVRGFVDPRTEIWDVAPFHVILPEAGFEMVKWSGERELSAGGVYSYRTGARDDSVALILAAHVRENPVRS